MATNFTLVMLFCFWCILIGSDVSADIDSSNGNVICIGLGTYGQSLCRHAIGNNLTVIAAFDSNADASSSLPPSLNERLNLSQAKDIAIAPISDLFSFLSTSQSSTSVTALIAMSEALDSLSSIVPIIKQCLSHSVNVITILTPHLSTTTLMDLHRIAMANNVRFKSAGLASFLLDTLSSNMLQRLAGEEESEEMIGRIHCNADYLAYIHRNAKPNIWLDWFIGQRVETYHAMAASVGFYKLLKNELNAFVHALMDVDVRGNDDWLYTFNSKAIYDQHGETVSAWLRRQIETGRITQIRYHGRLSPVDEDKEEGVGMGVSVSVVVKIGLFKDKEERDELTPCRIEWTLLDSNENELVKEDILNVDIVAAMMHDAIQNVVTGRFDGNCGVCCDENDKNQANCLQFMEKHEL